jgi:hypothetical protein
VSEDPDKAASEARGAELRENIALTDARRTEEEREKAERLHEVADREREQAPAVAPPAPEQTGPAAAVSGMPGVDKLPPAAQRPEVLVGAVFAGSFLVARILKRIFD